MLCHGLEIKFVHFGLFKIFGKGNPFAYGLQEALWCVDDCGRLRTSNVLPLTVFFSLRMFSGGDDETDTPFLSGRAFDTDKQSLRSVESEALF